MQYNTGSSDMSTVQDKGQRALIETLRKRFSLAPRRKEFAGIDTITWTLIDGGNNMEGLTKIIADVLQQDNDDPAGALDKIQLYSLNKLLEDHNAYRMYESDGQPKIERVSNLLVEYRSKYEQLSKAKRRVELAEERALSILLVVNKVVLLSLMARGALVGLKNFNAIIFRASRVQDT